MSKTKRNELTQLQSSNNEECLTLNMDGNSKHNLDRLHAIIEQVLNMKVSNAVILRRAIWLYRLSFLRAAFDAHTKGGTKEDMIQMMMDFCTSERQGLIDAAEGTFMPETEGD